MRLNRDVQLNEYQKDIRLYKLPTNIRFVGSFKIHKVS